MATERRIAPIARDTPSQRAADVRRAEEAHARAARRCKIAEIAATHFEGVPTPEGLRRCPTWDEIRDQIRFATRHGLITLGAAPSNPTLAALAMRWIRGERAIDDYRDADGRGRKPAPLHPELRVKVEELLDGGGFAHIASLISTAKEWADGAGIRPPADWKFLDEVRRLGVVRRIAARQGSRAAVMDGMPHYSLAADTPHDIATLDELHWPTWARSCDQDGNWFSVDPTLILVDDAACSAITGWHLVDPATRVDQEGRAFREGFDGADVLATLVSVAVPELAPGSTAPFAGFLMRTLRWDNASQHRTLLPVLKQLTTLEIARLPAAAPENRARIEARVRMAKLLAEGLEFHKDQVVPADRVPAWLSGKMGDEIEMPASEEGENPEGPAAPDATPADPRDTPGRRVGRARTRVSTAGSRTTRVTIVDVMALPTIGDVRRHIDRGIAAHQNSHHSTQGTTPAAAYEMLRDRLRARNGHELLAVLPVKSVLVDTNGVALEGDGRTRRYAFEVDGWLRTVGSTLEVRVDPLYRGLFVELDRRTHVLRPLPEYGRNIPPKELSKRLAAPAKTYSALASQYRDQEFGPSVAPTAPAGSGAPAAPSGPGATPPPAPDAGTNPLSYLPGATPFGARPRRGVTPPLPPGAGGAPRPSSSPAGTPPPFPRPITPDPTEPDA